MTNKQIYICFNKNIFGPWLGTVLVNHIAESLEFALMVGD